MTVPSYQVIVYFDYPGYGSAYQWADYPAPFQLDNGSVSLLDNIEHTLYQSSPVDVTADVTSVSIQRGSDSLLFPDAVAGTATVTLNNDASCSLGARTYDPMNTASPFYGNIIPGRRVDILAGGVTVFTGRIQDWNFSYDVSGRSIATMQCADGMAALARQEFDAWTATASQLPGARISAVLDDHDHETGLIRGVLCQNCNGIEGKINNLARRAKRQREKADFINSVLAYWACFADAPRVEIHPTHKTADEKRLRRNKKAKERRKKG
jgi:hypothetical protein